ncbi:MAG: polyphenol oxidase family protein [Acidobacteriota bacterium]|nr:polyphenol oxidase family protein [Acidobacteriota bacterium]
MNTLTSRRLAEWAGLAHGFVPNLASGPRPAPWRPIQVHGSRIARPATGAEEPREADAAVVPAGGPAVGVITADCVPLLLAGPTGAAAAVHAGWRPVAAGIVEGAVAAMEALGSPAPSLVAALGPAAGGCCYQVGTEVVEALSSPGRARLDGADRFRLDLRGVVRDRLVALGVDPLRVDVVGPCTICSAGWPSWRRQGPAAGRALAWIAPAPG